MANFFDQFDVSETPTAPASAPTSTNYFDQFDASEAPPAQEGLFDKIGTGMNVIRDWATGATKPKGSVLETIGRPVAPSVATEDPLLNPKFVQSVEAKLNSLPKDQRQAALTKMLKRPDAYGRAAKVVAGRYAGLDEVVSPTLEKFDPRLEAQKKRFEEQGRPPELAELDARYQALSGELRPDLDRMAETPPEYAEAAPYRVRKDLTGIAEAGQILLRGGVKAGLAYEQGVRGLNLLVGDMLGLDTSTNKARLDSINRFTEAMGEQSSKPLNLLEGAFTSIGQQAPALIGGAITGSEPAVLAAMFAQSFGQTYDEGRRKNLDSLDNVARSAMYAALEVLGEKFGLGDKIKAIQAAAKGMPSDKIAGFFAKSLKKEVPGEELTYAGQFAVDKGYGVNPEAGIADFISGAADTALSTILQTGLMTGAGVAAGKGINKAQELRARIQAGQRQRYVQDTSTDGLAELMARSRGFLTPERKAKAASTDLGPLGGVVPGQDVEAPPTARDKRVEELVSQLEESGVPFEDAVGIAQNQVAKEEEALAKKQEQLAGEIPKDTIPTNRAEELTQELIAAGFPPNEAKQRAAAIAEQEIKDDAEAETGTPKPIAGADRTGTAVAGQPPAGGTTQGPTGTQPGGVVSTGPATAGTAVGEGAQPTALKGQPPAGGTTQGPTGTQPGGVVSTGPATAGTAVGEGAQPTALKGQEPPVAAGMTRLYHGSVTQGRYTGPAWFSTSRTYAQDYRKGAELQYVDVPTTWVNKKADPDNYGQTPDKGYTFNVELDSSVTGPRKPLTQEGTPSGTQTPQAKQAEAQGQEAAKTDIETDADKARAEITGSGKRGRPALVLTPEQQADKDAARRKYKADYMRAARAAEKHIKALEAAIKTGNQTNRRIAYKELLRLKPTVNSTTSVGKAIKAALEARSDRFTPAELETIKRELQNEKPQGLPSIGATPYKADPKLGKVTNGAQAIAHIIKNGNPFQKLLAQRIRGFVNGVKIVVVEKDDPIPARLQSGRTAEKWGDARGMYVPSEKTIYVRGASFGDSQGVNNVTVLHELLHAATAQKIKLGSLALERGWSPNNAVTLATLELQRTMGSAKERFDELLAAGKLPKYIEALNRDAGVFDSLDEFLAYGMSDDAMQTFLLGAKGREGGTHFFSRFVNSVRNFFGMGADSVNALSDLILITDKLLSARKSPTMRFLEAADRATARGEDRVLPQVVGGEDKNNTSIRVQPSANVGRLAKMLGSKLYGTPDNIGEVSLKEIFQNSFDAIKESLEKGQIAKGRVDITADEKSRSLLIVDNGPGMPTSVMGNQFLQIAGTVKNTESASGGLGIAKMLFLFENKQLEVVSLRDGVLSRMTATGEDLKASLNEPERGPVIITSTDPKTIAAYEKTMFPDGHGTAISIVVPETYIDESNGEEKKIRFGTYDLERSDVMKFSPLFRNIEVNFKTYSDQKYSNPLPIGDKFPADKFTPFANVRFAWGTARIYVSKDQVDSWGKNAHILSNGLWQFSRDLKDKPGWDGKKIKRQFYLDISTNKGVKPEDAGYPFDLNRQNFSKTADKDFTKIFNYLAVLYRQEDLASEVTNFGTVQYINDDGTFTDPEKLEPKAPPSETALTRIKPGDSVEVRDGVLYVNNREVPELTEKDLKDTAIRIDELTIPQGEIDPTRVMVHDNMATEAKAQKSAEDRLADLADSNSGKFSFQYDGGGKYAFEIYNDDGTRTKFVDTAEEIASDLEEVGILTPQAASGATLSGNARAKFGERYDDYIHTIGNTFLQLRNILIAADSSYDDVPIRGVRLSEVGIGVSLDNEYYGVSTKVPFEAMFINPATTSLSGSARQIAVSLLGTMQHELAHHRVRSHDADFASEMQKIMNILDSYDGVDMADVKKRLTDFIEQNLDIFRYLEQEFKSGNYKPSGKRLKDAGSYQARDEGTTEPMEGTSPTGEDRGPSLSRIPESGAPSAEQVGVGEGDGTEAEEDGSSGVAAAERSQKQLDNDVNVAEYKVAQSRTNEQMAKAMSLLQLARKPKNIIPQLKMLWKSATYHQRTALVRLPTVEFLVNWANTAVPEIRNTYELMQKMSGMTQQILKSSGILTTDVHRAFLADSALRTKLEDLAFKSTIAQVDPSDPNAKLRSAKLDAEYAALGSKGQELYKRIKTHFENLSNLYSKLLDDQIKNSNLTPEQKDNLMVKLRKMYETDKKITPYFPLVRRGDFWLAVGSGKTRQFYMYESLAERDTAMRAMADKTVYQRPNESAADFEQRKKDNLKEMIADKAYEIGNDIHSLRRASFDSSLLLRGVFDSIDASNLGEPDAKDALKDAIYQIYLQTMPDNSFRNQFINRKNIAGFSTDLLRGVSTTSVKMATQLARIKYAPLIRNSLSAARDSIAGRPQYEPFVTEMDRRATKLLGFRVESAADTVASIFNKASFFYYLGGASSALLQPISVFQTGMPVLAGRYGAVNATREMSKLARVWSQLGMWRTNPDGTRTWVAPSIERASGLTPEERKAVKNMVAYGVAESTFTRAIYEQKGSPTEKLSGPKVQMAKDAVGALVMGGLMHSAERISREMMFLTSFRLNMKQHGDFDRAVREAVNDTNEALGNYGGYNRPLYMQSSAGKVLTQFQMYPLQVSMFLLNNFKQMIVPMDGHTRMEAATKFFGTLGTTFALAGAVGLPTFSILMGLVGAFWKALGDDDLLPADLKEMSFSLWFRTVFLPSLFGNTTIGGKKLSAIIERGPVNALTGLDIGGRTGLDNMFFREGKEPKNLREEIMALAVEKAGPGVNMILSYADAYEAAANGDYQKFVEKALPAGFRNFVIAHKYMTEGAKDTRNVQLLSKDAFATGELIGQAIGFRSDLLANAQYVNFKVQGLEQRINNERTKLLNNLDRESAKSNFKAFTDTMKDIHKFNTKFPSYAITEENMLDSLHKRAEQRAASFKGVTLTEKNVPVFIKALKESREELAKREQEAQKAKE